MADRTLADLDTPCLVLDRERLERNCARMRAVAERHGVALRPHLKTAKCMEVARLALGDGPPRAAVSTLEEAAWFVERGLTDLIYAVGIAPFKLDAVAALRSVAILTDDVRTAEAIAARADALGARFAVWIEIDSGHHRGGVSPDDDALLEIARALRRTGRVELCGVLTHAGHSYGCADAEAIARVAEQERSAAVRAAERLRGAGFDCPAVSVGSTPTAVHARDLAGASDLRPGVYVFGDLYQAELGSCARDDIALSVLSTVVGSRAEHAWLDAGALALTQDRSMDRAGGGYGEVTDLALRPWPGAPRIDRLNQVHGRFPASRVPVGTRVRVLPNHACLTAAMFDRYYVLEGDRVTDEWERIRG